MFESDRSYVFRQIRIIDPATNTDRLGDVWLEAGSIKAIESRIETPPDGTELVDAQGYILGPGLVDLYAQSGEPGFEQRETMQSLGDAAVAGGFTHVGLLPNTEPAIDTPDRIQAILNRQSNGIAPCWHPFAAITQNAGGQSLTELVELRDKGASAFCDNRPIASLPLLRRFLEYVRPLNTPILLWPQERSLAGGAMLEGEWSIRLGMEGISAAAEPLAIAQIIELVALTRTPVHLMRVSQARSVELLQQARSAGLPISASTTWMHLLMRDRDIQHFHFHPALHLHAPLGTEGDRQALLAGIKAGIVSAISTDHTPYTFEEKMVAFANAPPGAIGLELALSMLWQGLVQSNALTAVQLWSALSLQPATILGIAAPRLTVDAPANCTILNPNLLWQVNEQSLHSLSAATPYLNREISGKVIACWVEGMPQSGSTLTVDGTD